MLGLNVIRMSKMDSRQLKCYFIQNFDTLYKDQLTPHYI